MGINQQGNYLMKNLKESANLIKRYNGWLGTVQPYWIAYKKNRRNRIYNKSTYPALQNADIEFLSKKRLKFLVKKREIIFYIPAKV